MMTCSHRGLQVCKSVRGVNMMLNLLSADEVDSSRKPAAVGNGSQNT